MGHGTNDNVISENSGITAQFQSAAFNIAQNLRNIIDNVAVTAGHSRNNITTDPDSLPPVPDGGTLVSAHDRLIDVAGAMKDQIGVLSAKADIQGIRNLVARAGKVITPYLDGKTTELIATTRQLVVTEDNEDELHGIADRLEEYSRDNLDTIPHASIDASSCIIQHIKDCIDNIQRNMRTPNFAAAVATPTIAP